MKYLSPTLSSRLLLLLLLSFGRAASASTAFPEALRQDLSVAELPYPAPSCQLCHKDDVGGLKTATKPFARGLLKNGVAAGNVPSLLAALSAMEADGTDSDGDGAADIAELRAGTDPNLAESPSGTPQPMEDIPLPETGCAVGPSRTPPVAAGSSLFMAALLLGLRRRRSAGGQ